MGLSWSKRNHHHHHTQTRPPLLPPPPPSQSPYPPPPPPSQSPYQPPPPPSQSPYQPPPPPSQSPYPAPPPPQHPYHPPPPAPLPYNNNYYYNYSFPNHPNNYRPYYAPQIHSSGWIAPPRPPPPQPPVLPVVPYVDHQNAKKVKNDVNVHKDTIRLQLDDLNHDSHLVSFTFDALVDGSITIFYFAKEGDKCKFTPIYPEILPVKVPFQKGVGQQFCQPSGTGVDLGFFDTDDLSKPIPGEDVYPLIISAESHGPINDNPNEELVNTSPHAQISQAVLQKKEDGNFQVKVIKQILWVDGVRYELRDIFGISDSDETAVSDVDSGKECVICMTEVKNTAVLPCRHMCMCSECAKELRLQSNKCPVCRQPIEELLEIKLDDQGEV